MKGKKNTGTEIKKSARPGRVVYVNAAEAVVPVQEPVKEKKVRDPEKVKKTKKSLGVVGLMAAVSAACAYGGFTYFYSSHFFEGTSINGIDVSGMSPYDVEKLIADNVEDYSIQIKARNVEPETISGKDIGYKYASTGRVLEIVKEQNPFLWFQGLFRNQNYTVETKATFDKDLLESQVKSLGCTDESVQVAPENAYVAYVDGEFEIVPETEGTEIQVKQLYSALDDAIMGDVSSIDLEQTPDVYVEAELTSGSEEIQQTLDAFNNYARASITYTFGDQKVVLDGNTIRNWLSFDEQGKLIQNDSSFQQKARSYVAELAAAHDTAGTTREFNTTNGRTVYVYGSAYGWQIDQEAEVAQLIADIRAGANTTREPVYAMRANGFGPNDFGDTYIEVDLDYQHMYYYRGGDLIFDSDLVSGLMYTSRQTPEGVYKLYYKSSPAVLRGPIGEDGTPEYETDVSFWMPFNGGIGFHDAEWQPYFGGDRYLYGGSHGCINLPYYSAAMLYELIDYDVPIICFY